MSIQEFLLTKLALGLKGDIFANLKRFEGSNFFSRVSVCAEHMLPKFSLCLIVDQTKAAILLSNIDPRVPPIALGHLCPVFGSFAIAESLVDIKCPLVQKVLFTMRTVICESVLINNIK